MALPRCGCPKKRKVPAWRGGWLALAGSLRWWDQHPSEQWKLAIHWHDLAGWEFQICMLFLQTYSISKKCIVWSVDLKSEVTSIRYVWKPRTVPWVRVYLYMCMCTDLGWHGGSQIHGIAAMGYGEGVNCFYFSTVPPNFQLIWGSEVQRWVCVPLLLQGLCSFTQIYAYVCLCELCVKNCTHYLSENMARPC